jgi:hypothetical protein
MSYYDFILHSSGANGFYAFELALRSGGHGQFPWPWLSFFRWQHCTP